MPLVVLLKSKMSSKVNHLLKPSTIFIVCSGSSDVVLSKPNCVPGLSA